MTHKLPLPIITALLLTPFAALHAAPAQDTQIHVRADHVLHSVSRLLTGACIEDVNHEIYGGFYSQMIFGESFQEPASSLPQFEAYGGTWKVKNGELIGRTGNWPKLISQFPAFGNGEAGVEVFLANQEQSKAGLIVRVGKPGLGGDGFDGYEVTLNAANQNVRLGRHRHDFSFLKEAPCQAPTGQWIQLSVKLEGSVIEVLVNGQSVIRHDDGQQALLAGGVGLRQSQGEARYRNLWVKTGEERQALPFEDPAQKCEISGMWRAMRRGSATGTAEITKEKPFVGEQSQRLAFTGGEGEFCLENQGLNRWGMHFVGGQVYEGTLWARGNTTVWVALESADGATVLAEQKWDVRPGGWERLEFSLTPKATETSGRFVVKLKKPGSVTLGYASLQPGPWGRYKGLPVRRDVAEALIDQGITILRYGGTMVNHAEYRWKNMVGPRDRRPPCHGWWYPYSTNGWGILDFMEFCDAAGFEYVPAFNMDETPQDMVDFMQYAKGSTQSEWGRRRLVDGHPAPYGLKYIELGNEEVIDENYWRKFKPLAEAIWSQDAEVILAVPGLGEANKKILDLAREHNREVWFDVHTWTKNPPEPAMLKTERSFIDALANVSPGAKYKIVIFELNAENHSQKRALSNALAINAAERDGRIPMVVSANCLQPDGQNDNGWSQGLVFLNQSKVWLQPPGYVTQMFSRNYQPELVQCEVTGRDNTLDVTAKRSKDGKTLVLQVVNPTDKPVPAQMNLAGFVPKKPSAQVIELSGPWEARNSATQPNAIVPQSREWPHAIKNGNTGFTFQANSVTVLRFD